MPVHLHLPGPSLGLFMESFDLRLWASIGGINPINGGNAVAQCFQPVWANRQDACSTTRFVENFWSVLQHPSAWTKERILPDGGLEMIFNLGEPQRLHERVATAQWA